jgi:hypothetical protein
MGAPSKAHSASAIRFQQSEFHGIHLSTEELPRKCRRARRKIVAKIVRLCGGG